MGRKVKRPFVECEVMNAETKGQFCKMAKRIMAEKQRLESAAEG